MRWVTITFIGVSSQRRNVWQVHFLYAFLYFVRLIELSNTWKNKTFCYREVRTWSTWAYKKLNLQTAPFRLMFYDISLCEAGCFYRQQSIAVISLYSSFICCNTYGFWFIFILPWRKSSSNWSQNLVLFFTIPL